MEKLSLDPQEMESEGKPEGFILHLSTGKKAIVLATEEISSYEDILDVLDVNGHIIGFVQPDTFITDKRWAHPQAEFAIIASYVVSVGVHPIDIHALVVDVDARSSN